MLNGFDGYIQPLARFVHFAELVICHGQKELRGGYGAANFSAERVVRGDSFCQSRLSLIPAAGAIERSTAGRQVIRILRARLDRAFSKLDEPARFGAPSGAMTLAQTTR